VALAFLSLAGAHAAPSYHVVDRIGLPDGGWDLVSFDPVLGRVYIAHGEMVTAVDPATKTVTGKLAPANRAHAAIPLNGGAEVMVTNGGDNTAGIFNAKTGAPVAVVKTGEKPDAAMFDRASGLAVVMNAKSGSLTLIDPKTHAAVGEIAVGGSLELGAELGGGRIAVNVEDRNEVAIVDLKARTVLHHIALTGCDGPTGIAYLAVSGRILSACANGVAAITDPQAGRMVKTLPIGKGPDTALYDAQRKLAFVPAGRSGELDVFADEAAGVRALGAVPTQMGARTGALDEASGRIYLVAADYAPPAAAGGKPQVKPGTIVLVVVAP
jgi:DNA-binding beta-propeller fold protein YncE